MSHHRRVRAWVQRHPIVAFVVMAYGFTWIAWAPPGYLAGDDGGVQTMLMLLGGWGPALAAIVVARSGKPVVGYGKDRGVRVAPFMAAAVAGFLVLVWRFRTGGRDVLLEGPGAGQASFSGLPLVSAVLGTAFLALVISSIYSSDQGVRSLLRGLVRWRVHPAFYAFALLVFPVSGLVGAVLAHLIEAPLPAAAIGGHPWEAWVPLGLSSFMLTFLLPGA